MEFHFSAVETNAGKIIVNASDYDEAVEKANEVYFLGEVNWQDANIEIHLERSYD